jgi:hypothetical protein
MTARMARAPISYKHNTIFVTNKTKSVTHIAKDQFNPQAVNENRPIDHFSKTHTAYCTILSSQAAASFSRIHGSSGTAARAAISRTSQHGRKHEQRMIAGTHSKV